MGEIGSLCECIRSRGASGERCLILHGEALKAPVRTPDALEVADSLGEVFRTLYEIYGEDIAALDLADPRQSGVDDAVICEMEISVYEFVIALPEEAAVSVLRYLHPGAAFRGFTYQTFGSNGSASRPSRTPSPSMSGLLSSAIAAIWVPLDIMPCWQRKRIWSGSVKQRQDSGLFQHLVQKSGWERTQLLLLPQHERCRRFCST